MGANRLQDRRSWIWESLDARGPLEADGEVSFTDQPPPGGTIYRIGVLIP